MRTSRSRPTRVPTRGLKVSPLVAGMVAGADTIDDMALLRHGGWAGSSKGCAPRPRWGRAGARSPSATSAHSTRSRRGSGRDRRMLPVVPVVPVAVTDRATRCSMSTPHWSW